MRALVLADTHLRPGGRRRLPDEIYDALGSADVILHAGDIITADLVHELRGFAPVLAVLGNNDDEELAAMLPEARVDEIAGVRIGMIHDSGPTKGRPARMSRRFPDCDLVIYGHSHIPFDGEGIAGQRLFNPGSPTERRMQPRCTYGVIDLADGAIEHHEIRVLNSPGG